MQGPIVRPAVAFLVNVAVLLVASGIVLKVRPMISWRLAAAAGAVGGATRQDGGAAGPAVGDALSLEHAAVTVQARARTRPVSPHAPLLA